MARRKKDSTNPHEWVNLITISGPFPGDDLLRTFWPDGLNRHDGEADLAADLASAYEAWQEEPQGPRHQAWFRFIIDRALSLSLDDCFASGDALLPQWTLLRPGGAHYRPHAVLHDPDNPSLMRLPIALHPLKQKLGDALSGFERSPRELMRLFCLHHQTPLGLVTNGEQWVLIHAAADLPTTYAVFTASDWLEERITLRAFINLLGLRRFFSVPAKRTTEALFEETNKDSAEITDTLGRQVREAVEILVRTFDQLDLESDRRLLKGVHDTQIYGAALTVMMRLVLVFCAEDRGLFPRASNRLYGEYYALSNLRAQLRAQADSHGEELLERGLDAWHRLLATFRLIYAGVDNQHLSMPAYGGSLFDPDRYPFLEGRSPGQSHTQANPPRVDNRTVLHLLEALQILRLQKGLTRFLDFQTLGPEDVGHVYEGLLDHTAKRAHQPVLGLQGTVKKSVDKEPEIALDELERQREAGLDSFIKWLIKQTGKSANAIARLLESQADDAHQKLLAACGGDRELLQRVTPFASLLRRDTRGVPFVVTPGGVYVTAGTDRRNSGAHYTPRSLSEETVRHTLDPLVYDGPGQGLPEEKWTLKSPQQILNLKICDPAMGSGAFLVQACRYLSALLVEAWNQQGWFEQSPLTQPHGEPSRGGWSEALIGASDAERLAHARRLVCTRCLYGVDKNPMAVEMAKLSLWLITLDASHPFTFLGHHLAHGDSLLGVADIEQLRAFHPNPHSKMQARPWSGGVREKVGLILDRVLQLRREIETAASTTIVEVNRQEKLATESRNLAKHLYLLADLLTGAALVSGGKAKDLRERLEALDHLVQGFNLSQYTDQKTATWEQDMAQRAKAMLAEEPLTDEPRRPFHWALAFPEVFLAERGGFSAMIGNPPFLGGKKITGPFGKDYREYLVAHLSDGAKGNADLCAYFYLRAYQLVQSGGNFGFIATNTIAQGDTREVGLDRLADADCSIYRAVPSRKWPGIANLEVAQTWIHRGTWQGTHTLNDKAETGITSYLSIPGRITGSPHELDANNRMSFIGSYILGMGFVLTEEEAQGLIAKDPRNKQVLFPYLNGEDLNSSPTQSPSRWVINFFDWPLNHETKDADWDGPVAADYPDCLAIIEEKVKEERLGKAEDVASAPWWQYWRLRGGLYSTISKLENIITTSLVNSHLGFALVSSVQVFAHRLAVFPFSDFRYLSLLQSNFHYFWALKYSSTLETRLNYSPSDCFRTFPFPEDLSSLEDIGSRYHAHRQAMMQATQLGLTKTYNRFHDPGDQQEDINGLRALHRELDEAVKSAYGWDDLVLNHDFHETKQGLRYTIAPDVTEDILDRLLALNHTRYAQEVAEGKHHKKPKAAKPKKPKPKKPKEDPNQPSLF